MINKKEIGKQGEEFAKEYLEKCGYTIIETNFICRQGEIDIIATKNNELIFVEVKTRGQDYFGKPAEAVTNFKIKHIYKCAEYYIYLKKIKDINIRLDVIEIYMKEDKVTKIVHIKNAILEI